MESPQRNRGLGRARRLAWVAAPAGLLLAAAAVAVVWSARRAFERASEAVAGEGRAGFTLRALDLAAGARGVGAELVAARPEYTCGAYFEGELYLGGPAGLTVMGPDGSVGARLRSGFELPVGGVEAMAAGRVRGSAAPQLLLATGGAGLLLLTPGAGAMPAVEQLLPADGAARDVTTVLALGSGDVLLGTRHGGVLLYNGATLRPVGLGVGAKEITALAAVDSASFLAGTRDAGVFYVHGGTVEQADAGSGLPDDEVEAIAVSGGRAFVGTPVGTAEFDLSAGPAGGLRPVRTLAPGVFGHALAVGADELLIGTMDEGVQEVPLEGAALRRVAIAAGAAGGGPALRVDAFLSVPDDSGTSRPSGAWTGHPVSWASSQYALGDGDLLRRDGGAWTRVAAGAGSGLGTGLGTLTDGNVSALAFAPDGTLYIGYFDRGVDLLSPEGGVRHLEDDALFCINRLALDPERRTMDAATADGLVLFDAEGRPRQRLTERDGLISNHVSDVSFTAGGTVVATAAGITFLGAAGAESLYAFEGLANNHVYALAAGSGPGELLAGTLGGISMLKGKAVERNLTVANSGLRHNWITALLPLGDGTVLVGTYGAGLETMDGQGRFAGVELPAGTGRDVVINPNALYATGTHVYAGTLGGGMLVYSAASGRWMAVTDGLPSLNVTAFAARGGEIYVGTDNGLVRMAEAKLP